MKRGLRMHRAPITLRTLATTAKPKMSFNKLSIDKVPLAGKRVVSAGWGRTSRRRITQQSRATARQPCGVDVVKSGGAAC